MVQRIKILEVEDEAIIAMLMERELERIGYEVTSSVTSGENAINSITENPPDLVLMDIRLAGDMDGIETASIIKDRFNIPVIYISGYDDQHIRDRSRYTDPLGFFIKPVEMKKLKSLIDDYFQLAAI